jgi:hypothetical protein
MESRQGSVFCAASSEAIASEEALELPSMLLPVPLAAELGDNVIPFRRAA